MESLHETQQWITSGLQLIRCWNQGKKKKKKYLDDEFIEILWIIPEISVDGNDEGNPATDFPVAVNLRLNFQLDVSTWVTVAAGFISTCSWVELSWVELNCWLCDWVIGHLLFESSIRISAHFSCHFLNLFYLFYFFRFFFWSVLPVLKAYFALIFGSFWSDFYFFLG